MAEQKTLNRLRSKIERAEHHILDLQERWVDFIPDAYPVKSKDDPQSGERVWYLAYAKPIPNDFRAIAGDAVHNLRCALDHICHHLAVIATSGAGPFDGLYFPIAKNAHIFRERLKAAEEYKTVADGIIKRLGPDAVKAIARLEPYDGGGGAILYHLHQLDILDKHRLLLTVRGRNPTQTMPPGKIASYKRALGMEDGRLTAREEAVAFQTESFSPFPLKAGDELGRRPMSKADQEMYFPFVMAFGEPGVLKGKAVIPTLYQMSQFIRHVLRTFDRKGLLG